MEGEGVGREEGGGVGGRNSSLVVCWARSPA